MFMKKETFMCVICDYSCYQKSNMTQHVVSVHMNKKPFKCDICEFICSQKSKSNYHVVSVHDRIRTNAWSKYSLIRDFLIKDSLITDSWITDSWIYRFLKLQFLILTIPESNDNMLYQFMRERNHLNLTFVTSVVL